MKTSVLEVLVANYFDWRKNVIVSNVFWGFGLNYEADLMVLTKSNHLYEVELKTSIQDLRNDLKKRVFHNSKRTKYLYFAMPEELIEEAKRILPKEVGLLSAVRRNCRDNNIDANRYIVCVRKPKQRRSEPISDKDCFKLARLGTMRIWGRKQNDITHSTYNKNQTTLFDFMGDNENKNEDIPHFF